MGNSKYVCSCGHARPVKLADVGSGGSGVSVVSYSDIEAVERRGCAGCGRTGNVYAQDNAVARVRFRRRRLMRDVVICVVLFVAGWLFVQSLLQQGSEGEPVDLQSGVVLG